MNEKKMNYKIFKRKLTINGLLSQYKAKGQRRLNAIFKEKEQNYLDFRNLWNASSIGEEKQYEAIKTSGLLNSERKVTFIKFNYRHVEEKNLNFRKIYKNLVQKPASFSERRSKRKNIKSNSQKLKEILKNKENLPNLAVNWLEEYHGKQVRETIQEESEQQRKMHPGSMNVVDLWGEKQLKQSLGSLPCMRDRPKLLKMYSTKRKNFFQRRVNTQQ